MNFPPLSKYIGLILAFMMMTNFQARAQSANAAYDKVLADSLGADNYGMKMYVFVILKSGSVTLNKQKTDSLFNGHMQNINRLANAGKLVVAGPFEKNDKNFRGLFILNVKTTQEAQALLQTDPAISSGLLSSEMYGWYGSAALPMYLPASKKIEKDTF